MDLMLFLVLAFGLIVIPGPNIVVIVTTSIVHGKVRGLQTVAGKSFAMVVQLFIAALGTAWFVTAVSEGLTWLGVAYLLVLVMLAAAVTDRPRDSRQSSRMTSPEWGGFCINIGSTSVVIFVIYYLGILILKPEGHAPVTAYRHRPI